MLRKKSRKPSIINVSHALGYGDAIMFSSYVREHLATTFDTVCMNTPRVSEIQNALYEDLDNVFVNRTWLDAPRINIDFDTAVSHSSWRNLVYSRDLDAEKAILDYYTSVFGDRFILTHERPVDNGGRPMLPICKSLIRNPDRLPVINLDFDSLKSEGHLDLGLLSFRPLIERAEQIHVYEGSFCNIADMILKNVAGESDDVLDSSKPELHWHGYCKPYFWDERMVHNRILGLIEEGKWHANSWTYYGLEKEVM